MTVLTKIFCYGERIEKLSQQDKLSNMLDAGFLNVVETKDTAEFSQFKGWIRGNTKIGSLLEVATCCLHGKYGFKIRIMSFNKDNSHSWVRVSHGLNKLGTTMSRKPQKCSSKNER